MIVSPPGRALEADRATRSLALTRRDPDFRCALKTRLRAQTAAIERRLCELIAPDERTPSQLLRSVEYALLAPGKRVRPLLCILAADALAEEEAAALDAGCAVEMVHTASLILDDLPSMDDAQLRRGRLATHKVFGEAVAILTAISLLARAFDVLAALETTAEKRNQIVALVAETIGLNGLSAGQLLDLLPNQCSFDAHDVEQLHQLKTGVLFSAALKCGVVLAGGSQSQIRVFGEVGDSLGIAFQMADDLADVTAPTEEIGKDVGKDGEKQTIVALDGTATAKTRLRHRVAHTRSLLERTGGETEALNTLLDLVFDRALR